MNIGSIITNMTNSVSFFDNMGIKYEVKTGQKNHFLAIETLFENKKSDNLILKIKIKNVSEETLYLDNAAVIDVSDRNEGRLNLDGNMVSWTMLSGGFAGITKDICVQWHDFGKNDFNSHHYAVVGNNKSRKYCTLGFITFSRQNTWVNLKAGRDTIEFEHLKAICEFDGFSLTPGMEVESELLYVNCSDSPQKALEKYIDLILRQSDGRPELKDITGWATWDYYQSGVTEDDVIENVKWLAERRNILPVEYIQLDHGFEICEGDWLTTNERFPHGLKWLTEEIKRYGFKPGLWLCPFLAAPQSRVYKEHPDWMIMDSAGKALELNGYAVKTVYGLDCSIPGVCEWLEKLGCAVTKDYGFEYIKLDGANGQIMSPLGVFADKSVTKGQAVQDGLKAFRRGLKQGTFLLNACMFGNSAGLVDGMRVGGDVGARWDATLIDKHRGERDGFNGPGEVSRCIAAMSNSFFQHRKLWINDYDYLLVRQEGSNSVLTYEEAKSWASLVSLSNGLVMMSDKMPDLLEERIDILKRVLPQCKTAASPIGFFEKEVSSLYNLKVKNGSEKWNVACLVNVDLPKRTRDYEISFEKLSLSGEKEYHVFDFWNRKYMGSFSCKINVSKLLPHHCIVLGIREKKDIPQIMATDMHISQGELELESSSFEDGSLKIKMSTCGKKGNIYIYIPEGYKLKDSLNEKEKSIYEYPITADGQEYKIDFI